MSNTEQTSVSPQATTFINIMNKTEDPIEICMIWEFIAAQLDVTTVAQIHSGIKEKLMGMLTSDVVETYLQTASRKQIIETRLSQIVLYGRTLTKEESIVVAMTDGNVPWKAGLQLLQKTMDKEVNGEFVSDTMVKLQQLSHDSHVSSNEPTEAGRA